MGIKFLCPNGHKLNVKSFLSGKKAICPQCGAKVTVPAQSQPAAGGADADDEVTPEDGSDVSPAAADQIHAAADVIAANFASKGPVNPAPANPATLAPAGGAFPGTAPVAGVSPTGFGQSAAANPAFGAWGTAGGAVASGFAAREPVQPQSPAAPMPMAAPAGYGSPAVRDAIDEAPAAVWYVRPASGGQFGPAPGETMRAWIDEGRVAATALVWRAGWPEWRSAAATFPKLAATVAAPWSPSPGYGAAPAAPAMPMQPGAWGAAAPVGPMGMAPAAMAPGGMAPAGIAPGGMVMAPVQPVGAAAPAGFPVGQVVGGLAMPIESFTGTDAEDPTTRVRKRRRQQADMTMIVSVILVVLTVVLVIVLVVVLNHQNEPESGDTHPRASETSKEKPAKGKEPAKKTTTPAKKTTPGKKTKPAETMEDDADE